MATVSQSRDQDSCFDPNTVEEFLCQAQTFLSPASWDLPTLTQHIETGIRLRRVLETTGGLPELAERVDEAVAQLQAIAFDQIEALKGKPTQEIREPLETLLDQAIQADRQALDDLIRLTIEHDDEAALVNGATRTAAESEAQTPFTSTSLSRVLRLDRLQRDLHWREILAALLDQRIAPHPLLIARRELDALENLESAALAKERPKLRVLSAPPEERLPSRLERSRLKRLELSWELFTRQIDDEMAEDLPNETNPVTLWERRFLYSRLLSELVGRLDDEADQLEGHVSDRGRQRAADIAAKLNARRAELAERAWRYLIALPPGSEQENQVWETLLTISQEEYHEIITIIEELRLDEAAELLGLAQDDFQTLAQATALPPANDQSPLPSSTNSSPNDLNLNATANANANASEPAAGSVLTGHPSIRKRARRKLTGWAKRCRNERQEKKLAFTLETRYGRRPIRILEVTVLVLIVVLAVLLVVENRLESRLSPEQLELFAWADLLICSVFLFEFAFKLGHAEHQALYFRRRFWIDLFPSLPYGFISFQLDRLASLNDVAWLRTLRFLRIPTLARYLRLARPIIRLGRVLLLSFRLIDRLVRRYAPVFNCNIVLFASAEREEAVSRHRSALQGLKTSQGERWKQWTAHLKPEEHVALMEQRLGDLGRRVAYPPATPMKMRTTTGQGREIRLESVIEHLLEMTPETLVETYGQEFAESIERYLRMFDAPLIRNLPGIRDLIHLRGEVSAPELAALAANMLGEFLQRLLNIAYYFADLWATISPPLLLDRVGTSLVNTGRYPARRMINTGITLGIFWLVLYLIPLHQVPYFGWVLNVFQNMAKVFGYVAIGLGTLYLLLWQLGRWLQRLGAQESEVRERLVDSQFATQTRLLKRANRLKDERFLNERVLGPELRLRLADDFKPTLATQGHRLSVENLREDENGFIRVVRLLYNDYLEGSPLNRNDTRTVSQLVGNPALANLRNTSLESLKKDLRELERIDLQRSGLPIVGGPFVWFTYITRRIVHETAKLIVDYNTHAIPWKRLACLNADRRRNYRHWLAGRLGVPPDEIILPDPIDPAVAQLEAQRGEINPTSPSNHTPDHATLTNAPIHRKPIDVRVLENPTELLETIEFTAMDFLTRDQERVHHFEETFGPQLTQALDRDRALNIRSAFQSFPLESIPLSKRTFNPFLFYETRIARGKFLFLPLQILVALFRLAGQVLRLFIQVVHSVMDPQKEARVGPLTDGYAVARRKILRMRRPVFMQALTLRSRFDVEYLGLRLPGLPLTLGDPDLLLRDLDYIGATRHERVMFERHRQDQAQLLDEIERRLIRHGFLGAGLDHHLKTHAPHLVERRGEVIRALITALIVDFRDLLTLARSIDAVHLLMRHALDPYHQIRDLPEGLPQPALSRQRRRRWYQIQLSRRQRRKLLPRLFEFPGFPHCDRYQRDQVLRYLNRHMTFVADWLDVVLSQGDDPEQTLRERLNDVIIRADLFSDQIVVMRAVQTLTIMDVQYYCELTWKLGRYHELEPNGSDQVINQLPFLTPDPAISLIPIVDHEPDSA